jgi:hypothetical protein
MMSDKKIAIYLLLFGFGFSCTNNEPETTIWSESTQMVFCDTLTVFPRSFIGHIILKDSSLIIINSQISGAIHIVDIQTGQRTNFSLKDSLNTINPALFPFSFYHYLTNRYYHCRMEIANSVSS